MQDSWISAPSRLSGIFDLSLPPTTFSHFWAATAASDGGARDIIIYFKVEAAVFKITRVLLVEHTADHKQTHAPPVVAEPRDVKWPSILLGFLVAFAIGAVLAVIGHELWPDLIIYW